MFLCERGETGGCGLFGPVAGVLATELWLDGKLAGWNRGSEGSFSALVLWRRWPAFAALRGCRLLRAGGCMAMSNRSNRGERGEGRGDDGRNAVAARDDGIPDTGEVDRAREGETPLEGAVMGKWVMHRLSVVCLTLLMRMGVVLVTKSGQCE